MGEDEGLKKRGIIDFLPLKREGLLEGGGFFWQGGTQGDSVVLHCASLTAHNKMAAVKKIIQSNIIKMKLSEEKRY